LKLQKLIEYSLFTEIGELPTEKQDLLERALLNTQRAYAPYSNFYVGAALLLENGKTIDGANQENASYPMCTCAETTALVNAAVNFPNTPVRCIAVTVRAAKPIESPVSPCGKCRQQLIEQELKQEKEIEIILRGETGPIYTFSSAKILLPFYFDGSALK
jgi:cytidine deaminase